MPRDTKIWCELATRVALLYCPELKQAESITLKNCRDTVMLAISNFWELDYDTLPREQTFYNAMHGTSCGCAMREMLAVFYYAFTDPACAAEMPALFLVLAGKERTPLTPYWNRFVEEYKKEHARQTAKSAALFKLMHLLDTLKKEELDKVEEKVKELRRGK